MDGIQSKEFAGSRNRRLHRNGCFVQTEPELGLMRNLVEGRGKPTPRGVAHHPDAATAGGNHDRHEVMQRCGIRADLGLKSEVLTF